MFVFERAQTGRMQKAKATQDASKRNVKVVMDVRCVPPTYSNFVMLRALAKKLCWEKEYMQAFHQLEHAAYVLQMINLQCDEEDVLYGSKAADVLDDMACIMQLQCDYGRAHRYLMVRLQTLTGFDDPLLEDFVVDEDGIGALSDTYSALFTVFSLQGVKMWCEGDFANALEAFKSSLHALDRCCYIGGNYVQIRNTRRNVASVLRSMKREEEAVEYDAEIAEVNCVGALDGAYTDEEKIFYRPTHGGAPELYLPGCGCDVSDMSSEENRQEIKALARKVLDLRVETKVGELGGLGPGSFKKKADHAFQCLKSLAAMDYLRKQEDSDRAMQELLAEEEEDKKRALERKSSKNNKKKAKAKQARERKQGVERVVEERFQVYQDSVAVQKTEVEPLSVALLPLRLDVVLPETSVSVSAEPPVSQESEIAAYLEHFVCPISLEIMEDPVITADGSSYERASIEAWFKKTDRDPLTNAIVASKALIPNKALKSAILAATAAFGTVSRE